MLHPDDLMGADPSLPIHAQAIQHFHATPVELREAGLRWYDQSLADVRELAAKLPKGVGLSRAAAILAALSPQTQWVQNWLWARQIAEAAGLGRKTMPTIGGFPINREKAWKIANGADPAKVLRGPKVTAFWRALAGDPDAVVLDIWMFRAFGLPDTPPQKVYDRVALEVERAANDLGVTARQLQAIIWLKVRGVRPSDPDSYFPTATKEATA